MSRLCGLLVVLFSVTAFATSNLMFSPDTIISGDSTELSFDFSHAGDTANIVFFIDLNANDLYDDGADIMLMDNVGSGEIGIIDGNSEDDDVADGHFSITFSGDNNPFSSAGSYVMIIEDSGPADTATLVVKPVITNTYVRGTVSGPSGVLSGIVVKVSTSYASQNSNEGRYQATTDNQGNFIVYIPASDRDTAVSIWAVDDWGVMSPPLIAPEMADTAVHDSLVLNFAFTSAAHFIKCVVVDQDNQPMPNVSIQAGCDSANMRFEVDSDDDGLVVLPVVPGTWRIENNSNNEMRTIRIVSILSSQDTVDIGNFQVFTADETISGKVTGPIGNFNLSDNDLFVEANFSVNDSLYYQGTGHINSDDSTYSIAVSSALTRYRVQVGYDQRSYSGYFVNPSSIDSVTPGTQNVDFAISQGNKRIIGVVVDNHNAVIADVELRINQLEGQTSVSVTTNDAGQFAAPVIDGSWQITLGNNPSPFRYMHKEVDVTVPSDSDTVHVQYVLYITDTSITGVVHNRTAESYSEFVVYASEDSAVDYRYATAIELSDSTFEIYVSKDISYYSVSVYRRGDISHPTSYVTPGYGHLAPGRNDLEFTIYPMSGFVTATTHDPNNKFTCTQIGISDTAQHIIIWGDDGDNFVNGIFTTPLPIGQYVLLAKFSCPDSADKFVAVPDIIINAGARITIDITPAGGTVGVKNARKTALAFGLNVSSNPFRGRTNLIYSLPTKAMVSLKIFDLQGKMVANLVSGMVMPGVYSVEWNASGHTDKSGMYIAQLVIGGKEGYHKNEKLIRIQ